jgi:hypothetical protein
MRADALEVMLDFAMILCFKNEPTRSLLGIRAKTFWENFGEPKFWAQTSKASSLGFAFSNTHKRMLQGSHK